MKKEIHFQNMEHSDPLELHINQKLEKLKELLDEDELPQYVEIHLTAGHLHAHHRVEISLKTKNFSLVVTKEGPAMYVVFDDAFDALLKSLKREKEKLRDKIQKRETEKILFRKD